MNFSWIFALQLSFIGLAPAAFPQALEETTALLNDPGARNELAGKDPAARDALNQVSALGLSPAREAKIYELSGKILAKMNDEAQGDSGKMSEQTQGLLRDPSSLHSLLTPEQTAEIHELSKSVEPARSK